MMTIRVRVTKVDMYGFCGRDFHPDRADEGCEGTVTNIDLEPPDDSDEPEQATHPMMQLTDGKHGAQLFYVRLDNGRCVQLFGHELQLLSCTHDGDF